MIVATEQPQLLYLDLTFPSSVGTGTLRYISPHYFRLYFILNEEQRVSCSSGLFMK